MAANEMQGLLSPLQSFNQGDMIFLFFDCKYSL